MHNMINISFNDTDDCERHCTVFDLEDSRQCIVDYYVLRLQNHVICRHYDIILVMLVYIIHLLSASLYVSKRGAY